MPKTKDTEEIDIKELEALRADSARLKQFYEILPPIISEGATRRLRELPIEAQPALAWHMLSNEELRSHDAPGASYEKLRRSFIGIQRWNTEREPMERVYPTAFLLSKCAGCDRTIAQKWMAEKLVSYEVQGYAHDLAPEKDFEHEQDEHNGAIQTTLSDRIETLVQWPTEFD